MTFPQRFIMLQNGLSGIDGPTKVAESADVSNALDGGAGGAYAPSAELDVGGKGLGHYLPALTGTLPWPAFGADPGAKRSFTRTCSWADAQKLAGANSITFGGGNGIVPMLLGAGGGFAACYGLGNWPPQGAIITAIRSYFVVPTAHTATNYPQISLYSYNPTTNANDILIGTQIFPNPVSGPAYQNGGVPNMINLTGLAVTVNRATTQYVVALYDEGGGLAGNLHTGFQIDFTLSDFEVA